MPNLETLTDFILNYIFIGIPQTLIILLLSLVIIKEHDYLKSCNFSQSLRDVVFMGGIQSAFFVNALFYFSNLALFPRLILNILIYSLFIYQILKSSKQEVLRNTYLHPKNVEERPFADEKTLKFSFRQQTQKYIYTISDNIDKFKYKNKKGIFFSVVFLLGILFIIEVFTSIYLQYVFKFDMNSIPNNIFNSILFTYPELIILSFAIYLAYVYVNTKDVTILKIWKISKTFRITTYIQITTTFIFSIGVYMFVIKDNLLQFLNPDTSYKIALILYTLLILHILIPWSLILNKEIKEHRLNKILS